MDGLQASAFVLPIATGALAAFGGIYALVKPHYSDPEERASVTSILMGLFTGGIGLLILGLVLWKDKRIASFCALGISAMLLALLGFSLYIITASDDEEKS
ncbi:hypothetical protein ACFROC_04940 [Nocardia tengchongensis]|uniref:hypothetical protein n=1 Tax=Nocardia tengchongensis TaxID=2055889 RepID=UPI00369EACC8